MVVDVLKKWGGVAQRATLIRATSRQAVDLALLDKTIVVDSRGRYALPAAEPALRTANRMHAVLSHRSAAAYWGWEQKFGPERVEVTVARKRRIRRTLEVQLHYSDLADAEIEGCVTSRRRTLLDCLRSCPFDEALTIADSALRNGDINRAELRRLAMTIRGVGATNARRVARHANGLAANPFESVLRAIAIDAGLSPQPQVGIRQDGLPGTLIGTVDLVDREHRLILEADSYQFHGGRAEFARDCHRYNTFVLAEFRVLRFSWEAVMHRPQEVRATLERIVRRERLPVILLEPA